jgi:hypothetical protein
MWHPNNFEVQTEKEKYRSLNGMAAENQYLHLLT